MNTFLFILIISMDLIVCPINAGSEMKTAFCSLKDESLNISRAFISRTQIYFGDEMSYQTVDIKDNFDISRKHTFKEIFGQTISFTTIISGVYFPFISCDPNNGTDCEDLKKAADLLLIIGTMGGSDTKFAFKGYRAFADQYPTAVDSETKMPWNLKNEALLQGGQFWIDGPIEYQGITFDDTTTTLYVSTKNSQDGSIFHRKLQNGKFSEAYEEATVPPGRIYTGLIDWKGKLYGLSKNIFYELSLSGTKISEKGEFSAKQMFNCEENSPLKDNNTVTPGESPDQNSTVEGNETSVTAVSEPKIGDETGITSEPQSPTTSEPESKSNNWIIYVIIVIVIIIIIIIIICCLFCCKKSDGKEASKDKDGIKSAPDSKIQSEGGSKIPSKIGSKADKNSGLKEPSTGDGSGGAAKGGAVPKSSVGSGGAKGEAGGLKKGSLTTKSTDSTASLRSSKISNI